MDYIKKILSSRTIWGIVVLFLVNGVAGIHDPLTEAVGPLGVTLIDGALSALTAYFRVVPKVDFTNDR